MCSLTVAIPCVEWTGFDRINPGGSGCLVSCSFFLHTMREFFSLTVVPPHQQDNTCNFVHNHNSLLKSGSVVYAWPSGLLNCGKSFSIEQKAASLVHQTGGEYPRCECVNSHSDVQFVPLWVCLLSFGKFVFIRGCSLSLEFCFGVFLICFALLVIDGPKVCLNSSLKASTHFELSLSTSCQPKSLLLTFSTHGPNQGHCDWCRASKFIKRLSQWTCQNRRNEKPQRCVVCAGP